jgi:23S rRNA (uracil1939-C5)-methyltransferase
LTEHGPTVVRIDGLAAGGDGVGRDAEGRVLFVPLTAPGDRVRVRIVESRKRFARGEVLELLEAGPARTTPPCAVFGSCGGCTWQHLSYEAQLAAKGTIVEEALRRIGRFDPEAPLHVTPSPSPYGYRSRARLVQEGERLGYRMRRSHRICVIDACPVLRPELQAELGRKRPRRPSRSAGPRTDEGPIEWDLAVGDRGEVRARRTGGRESAADPIELDVGGDLVRVSRGVFGQSNSLLVGALADAVVRRATAGRESVSALELYAGAGLFTLGLARRFDRVWAVEANPGAVADLRFNLARAGLDSVETHAGTVEGVLPGLGLRAPDVLVLDPPRSGVSPAAMAEIESLGARRIVYVSCDPATLARDLGRLRDHGYRLDQVEAFDLFPQTPHVESVATLLARRGSGLDQAVP